MRFTRSRDDPDLARSADRRPRWEGKHDDADRLGHAPRRKALVDDAVAEQPPQAHRHRGRRQCRHAVLQPAQSARALQRARHAEMPAHLQAHARPLPLLGHGAHLLLHRRRTRQAGTTRSAATPPRRRWRRNGARGATRTNRNDWYQNGHDSFLVEAAKYGLGRRDLAANVNWFSKVVVADDGAHGARCERRPRQALPSSCASRWTRSSSSTPARIR